MHLPTDPSRGNWIIPPKEIMDTMFANMGGTKRFALAESLNCGTLLEACIVCESFLYFFLRYEEMIVPAVLRNLWGYTLQEKHITRRKPESQDDSILQHPIDELHEAMRAYLRRFFPERQSSNSQHEALKLNGDATTDTEATTESNWKLVDDYFPNLSLVVSYERMPYEVSHLTRLWVFMPRRKVLYTCSPDTRLWDARDMTDFQKLGIIDEIHGQGLRGLVRFIWKRKLVMQEEERHKLKHPLPPHLWCPKDSVDIVNIKTGEWLEKNFTIEMIEEMRDTYNSLYRFISKLWKLAREYATEDGEHGDVTAYPHPHPDPDHIGPESNLDEEVICKQAVERLLVTLGLPQPEGRKKNQRATERIYVPKQDTFTILNLDHFFAHLHDSDPRDYKVNPTKSFREVIKFWRSEEILRRSIGAGNYRLANIQNADFFEKAVALVWERKRSQQADQALRIAQHAEARAEEQRRQQRFLTRTKNWLFSRNKVEINKPMETETDEDRNLHLVHRVKLPRNYVFAIGMPKYPTGSPVPEEGLGVPAINNLSQNYLEDSLPGQSFSKRFQRKLRILLGALAETFGSGFTM